MDKEKYVSPEMDWKAIDMENVIMTQSAGIEEMAWDDYEW